MSTLFGSILATALAAQVQSGTIQGKVVDDQGKPVADARVVYFTPRPMVGTGEPVEVETKTDAGGHFLFVSSHLKRAVYFRFWSYRPGSAIAFKWRSTNRWLTWPYADPSRERSRSRPRTVNPSPVRNSRHKSSLSEVREPSSARSARDTSQVACRHHRAGRQGDAQLPGGLAISWSRCGSRPRRSALRTCSLSRIPAAITRAPRSPSGSSQPAGWQAGSGTEPGNRSPARRSKSGPREATIIWE